MKGVNTCAFGAEDGGRKGRQDGSRSQAARIVNEGCMALRMEEERNARLGRHCRQHALLI